MMLQLEDTAFAHIGDVWDCSAASEPAAQHEKQPLLPEVQPQLQQHETNHKHTQVASIAEVEQPPRQLAPTQPHQLLGQQHQVNVKLPRSIYQPPWKRQRQQDNTAQQEPPIPWPLAAEVHEHRMPDMQCSTAAHTALTLSDANKVSSPHSSVPPHNGAAAAGSVSDVAMEPAFQQAVYASNAAVSAASIDANQLAEAAASAQPPLQQPPTRTPPTEQLCQLFKHIQKVSAAMTWHA